MSRLANPGAVQQPELLFKTEWRRPLSVFLFLMFALCCARGCLSTIYNPFTDHRLLPLFLILRHDPVYINPAFGPTLSTLYPPLSVLLYAPAALFHSPLACFAMAAFLSQILWLTPLFVAFRLVGRSDANSFFDALLLCTLIVMWCTTSTILRSLYQVHADEPAIFLAAGGVLAFVADRQKPRTLLILSSAALCSLAPWAKQPAFPVVFVPAVLLLAAREFRRFSGFTAGALLTHLLALAVWSRLFDLRLMFIWLFKIPASEPWKDSPLGALTTSNNVLMSENFAALTGIGIVLIGCIHRYGGVNRNVILQLSREPWFVFALTGLILWPTSVLGYCKTGATENALLYSTYFIIAGLALWIYSSLADHGRIVAAGVSTALVLLPFAALPTCIHWSRAWEPSKLAGLHSVQAYNFSRKWPGEVFFPWYPLSVYLAVGHVYNFDLGMCDRIIAGIKVDEANYRAHLPAGMKYVAYSGEPGACALFPIPEYKMRMQDPRLPDWTLYTKAAQ